MKKKSFSIKGENILLCLQKISNECTQPVTKYSQSLALVLQNPVWIQFAISDAVYVPKPQLSKWDLQAVHLSFLWSHFDIIRQWLRQQVWKSFRLRNTSTVIIFSKLHYAISIEVIFVPFVAFKVVCRIVV